MTRLLDIGVTGLTAHQRALTTTGHNIANAGVEGYSRQEAVFDTRNPQLIDGNYLGSGVNIETIRRITDELITRQSYVDISRLNELEILSAGVEQVDALLSNEETGLSGALNELFSSLQAVSEAPTSLPLRQQVISNAQRFIDRYESIYTQVQSIVEQTDGALVSQVGVVNSIASGIADLNASIQAAISSGDSDQPNDLLDRREQLMRDLAEKISFTTSKSGDMINIFVGGGQALVLGAQANSLSTAGSAASGQGLDLAINVNGEPRIISDQVAGGEIGGIFRLRNVGLDEAFNQLGLVQTLVSHSFNTLHNEGVDLNGLVGGDFFTPINDRESQLFRSVAALSNISTDTITSVTVDDPGALKGSSYVLELANAGSLLSYTLVRKSDGMQVGEGVLPAVFPQSITAADGFTVNLESGSFQSGDKFILSPSRIPPDKVQLMVADPASLALGLPVSTAAGVGNLGNAAITQVDALNVDGVDVADAELIAQLRAQSPPLVVRFTSATTYDVLDNSNPAQPVQLSPALRNLQFIPGQSNQILNFDLNATTATSSGAFAFTATAGALGTTNNGYPGETITINHTNPDTGVVSSSSATALAGESAAVVASRINSLSGAQATANTELHLQVADDGAVPPLELRLNGVDLTSTLVGAVPSPITTDFLAQRVNQLFAGSGISASSDGSTLSLRSVNGEDLTLENFGGGADSITVTTINGSASAVAVVSGQEVVVGGTVDVVLDDGVTGVSSGGHFVGSSVVALPAYTGYQIAISGQPQTGDEFLINTNTSGSGDNRNALALAGLRAADIVNNGSASIDDVYADLVGSIGNKASSARIDKEAAQSILTQTQSRLDSISGVNLDEEAANLLQYEQAYNASARVIAIARSLFDSLLGAFS
jgi:flagellar hook-associated protein 1 FlgK